MSFAHMTHNNETALLGKSQRERAITPWLPIFLLKITNTGLGDGNVVRKTHCSWGGPKFRTQHLIKWLPTICKSSSRPTPSYDLHRRLHVCCVYTYSQTHTNTHKPKKNESFQKVNKRSPISAICFTQCYESTGQLSTGSILNINNSVFTSSENMCSQLKWGKNFGLSIMEKESNHIAATFFCMALSS